MSVSTIAYDGGGFRPWQFLRDLHGAPSNSGQARDAGPAITAPSGWRGRGAAQSAPPAGASAPLAPGATNAAGSSLSGLAALESAGSTLIGDLQTFLVDLQAGATAGTLTAATPATATPATGADATDAGAAAVPTDAPAAGATPVAGTTLAGDTATVVSALQSFIDELQAGSTGQPASASPAPGENGQTRGAGFRHHHHHRGGDGAGGIAGELQTTNQLLGQILGAIGSYAAQGGQTTTEAATTAVSA